MQYDLFVIGTGTAGSDVATACAEAGWSVGIADERAFGGTCALRGCDPKKVLVHAAHVLDQQKSLDGHGLDGDLQIDWGELMAFKRSFTEGVPASTEEKFEDAGIDTFHGTARFTGPQTLEVEGPEGATQAIEAEHVLIAVGAKPVPLGIDGEEHFTFSDDFLELEALPERLVFAGGGYISMEFAHLAACAGARAVTVLETSGRPLANFEADVASVVIEAAREQGIQVETERQVTAIEDSGDGGFTVVAEDVSEGDGGAQERYEADAVVHGAGRVPQFDALDLEAAGVERDGDTGRLVLDEQLRSTTNPAVFAAGDAAQRGKPLTPITHIDARAVVKALLSDGEPPNYEGTPTVVFTTPRMAAVGLTEEEARRDFDVDVASGDASNFYGARHRRAEHAAYKIIAEKGTGRLLGAHMAYPRAGEAINVLALAIRQGLTVNDLKAGLYAYPSATADVQYMLP